MFTPRRTLLSLLVSSSIAALAACSSGGGGGSSSSGGSSSTSGMTMPDKLSVVTAKTSATAKPAGIALPYAKIARALPTTGDYVNDASRTHVWDPAIEPLSTVNEILCIVDQTQASAMVNQGPYVALVNDTKCSGNKSSSGGQPNASSSTQATQYSRWMVESTRTAGQHQYVKVWTVMDMGGGGGGSMPVNLRVYIDITEGVSAAKPFGDFSLAFAGEYQGAQIMGGTLATVPGSSVPQFTFIENQGDQFNTALAAYGGHAAKVNVMFNDATGTAGKANLSVYENYGGGGATTRAFQVAFDTNYFHRQKNSDPATEICSQRNSPYIQVWQYNLYDTSGTRVNINSSMPFTRDATGEYANVGYWGYWSESGTLNDGEILTRQTYGQGTGGKYTAHVTSGKLTQQVVSTIGLDKFVGMKLRTSGNGIALPGLYTDVVFQISGTAGATGITGPWTFTAVDLGYWDTTTQQYQSYVKNFGALPGGFATNITPATGAYFNFWGDGMNGWASYNGGADTASLTTRSNVAPGVVTSNTTLYCYYNCIIGGLAAGTTTSSSVLYANTWNAPHQYTLTPVAGGYKLLDPSAGNAEVLIPTGLNVTDMPWASNGMSTGDLLVTPSANYWQSTGTVYSWETGPNSWNKQVTVTDNATGTAVTFDPPLNLQYTYAAGDDPNAANLGANYPFAAGNTFMLQYSGPGQLWGFPGEQNGDFHWVNFLTLNSGVALTNLNGGTQYFVKQIEREEIMNSVAVSNCASLPLPTNTDMPLPTKADIKTVPFAWNDKDALNFPSAPAVVGGKVQ